MLHFNICISEMSIVMILINCRLTLFNWYLKRPCSDWSARYDPNGRYLFAKMALWYAQLPLIAGIVGSRGRNFKSRPVVKKTFLRDFHLFFFNAKTYSKSLAHSTSGDHEKTKSNLQYLGFYTNFSIFG